MLIRINIILSMSINLLNEQQRQNRQKIRSLFVLKGIVGARLAEELRVSPSTICLTISGHLKNPKMRKAIAKALGKKVKELWPKEVKEKL